MSYIKNCKICGQRISLREMRSGQWVAFDANTDIPHKHNKRNKAQKRPSYENENTFNPNAENDLISEEKSSQYLKKTEQKNIWPYIIIGIIILIFIYN